MKVNNKINILNMLKESIEPVSGEFIGNNLGISRTAVWKNINSLKDVGYTITSSTKGYLLTKEEDLLIPYEFQEDINLYTYKSSTKSTMDVANDIIRANKALDGTTVLTQEQTKGKGKGRKVFYSPKGGLYFTLILKPNTPIMDVNIYPMAALVAIKNMLEINIQSRWPFESWYNNEKISGILHEYKTEQNRITWLTLGIGINLNRDIPRRKLLIAIKKEIYRLLEQKDQIIDKYKNCLSIINRAFNFSIENRDVKGRVLDINRLGTLILETPEGIKYGYIGNSFQKGEI